MAQQTRQDTLFYAQDWKVIYQSFTQVNFQAYDFNSIKAALVEYIRLNYPEDFNNWSQNTEFVFIIDLLAYLAQSLAFRMDLDARENIFDTAQRRDSILRLAKFINYSPRRNLPSRGLLKLVAVRTDESIIDTNGADISGKTIEWNSLINPDWNSQFIQVMNSAFIQNGQYGQPIKTGTVGGIPTSLYQFNSVPMTTAANSFTATVGGTSMPFEIVNSDFDDLGTFKEREIDPKESKTIIYRNDGRGNASANTGFFVYFKQGTLQFVDYSLTTPINNRTIDINVNNINDLDVWVQEIATDGSIITAWSKVPTTDSVAYNSLSRTIRSIFSVSSRDNDQITLKFGDGRFGDAPVGTYRVWYRTSNGLVYQIRTSDIANVSITMPYTKVTNAGTQTFNLTMTYSLEYAIQNSSPAETLDQVRQRAPQIYYTQNRMVNGEDYNVFPLLAGNQLTKVKAINRTFSGHSRYIDINDPTGLYQNLNVFADDGMLYRQFSKEYNEESTLRQHQYVLDNIIAPKAQQTNVEDFFFSNYPIITVTGFTGNLTWKSNTLGVASSGGLFKDNTGPIVVGPNAIKYGLANKYINENCLVEVTDSSGTRWVKVQTIVDNGTTANSLGQGPVYLTDPVGDGAIISRVISAFDPTFTDSEKTNMLTELDQLHTFALRYDQLSRLWVVVLNHDINFISDFSLTNAGNTTGNNLDASWIILVEYTPTTWKVTTRTLDYYFESTNTVRFYYADWYKQVDPRTGLEARDMITTLKINPYAYPSSTPIGTSFDWQIIRNYTFSDGYIEPRRIYVSFKRDRNVDLPDDPLQFEKFCDLALTVPSSVSTDRILLWEKVTGTDNYEYYQPNTTVRKFTTGSTRDAYGNYAVGDVVYVADSDSFYIVASLSPTTFETYIEPKYDSTKYYARKGRNNIYFQWKHYAAENQLMDPAITNIIDMYVLTTEYENQILNWKSRQMVDAMPAPPTTDDLKLTFSSLEKFKTVSDQIVWNSATFKLLFGKEAPQELQCKFKVIKTPGSKLSNNEIAQKVVDAINSYFAFSLWDFGETFYFTELAAYIHQQLAPNVGSVSIVPTYQSSKFGNLFEIRSESNELFLPTARVTDVDIIDALTQSTIRIGN